jgi:osmoprotectant transport system substrate-binding protein
MYAGTVLAAWFYQPFTELVLARTFPHMTQFTGNLTAFLVLLFISSLLIAIGLGRSHFVQQIARRTGVLNNLTGGALGLALAVCGTILSTIAQQSRRPGSAQAAYAAAKRFQEGRGFTLTQATPFFNTDALAVLPSYAQQNGLKQIGDLKKLGAKVTYGAPPESRTRYEGLVGLRQAYGLTQLKFKPLAIGLQYKALDSGDIQTADVFTTDGQLSGRRYVVLADPKNVFGFQNVAMVVSQKVMQREGPAFAKTIDAVSAKLTTQAMRQMNAAADLNKVPPAAVARKFLQANGLI